MQIIYRINALHLDAQRNAGHDDDALPVVGLADRGEPQPPRPHGPPRVPRLAPRQRRVGAAHRAHAPDGVPRPARALSRPHRQQDQRHHVPPLAATRRIPGSRSSSSTRSAREVAGRRRRGSRRSRRSPTTRRFASGSPPCAARTRSRWRGSSPSALGFGLDPDALFDVHIKRIHEYKRQLLNILETIALYNAMRAQPDARVGAAGEDLRGQGGGRLPAGEAHHQAHPRRRARDQPRSRRARPAQGGLPAELQREPRRGDHPGGRPVRADLDRGHGSLRHRQHEARAQRRAHDRHARRREHRDPRARRRREHVHLRAHRRRSRRAAPRRASTRPPRSRRRPRSPKCSTPSRRACSRRTTRAAIAGSSMRCAHHDYFMVAADFEAYRSAQRAVDALWQDQSEWWRIAVLNTARIELVLLRPRDPATTRRRSGARNPAWDEPSGGRAVLHRPLQPMAATAALARHRSTAIVEGRHDDPFAVLGVHEADGAFVVRAFVPGADDGRCRDARRRKARVRSRAGTTPAFSKATIPRRTALSAARREPA